MCAWKVCWRDRIGRHLIEGGPWSTITVRSDLPTEVLMRAIKARVRETHAGALAASYVPARRASLVSPLEALRQD
jgi:ABC-type lipoprotein release transport system permease subunit